MGLFIQADKVVRNLAPIVLSAAGDEDQADILKGSLPICDEDTAQTACDLLAELDTWYEDGEWNHVVKNFLFWVEAAVWAAMREDPDSFKRYVERATEILMYNLPQYHAAILN